MTHQHLMRVLNKAKDATTDPTQRRDLEEVIEFFEWKDIHNLSDDFRGVLELASFGYSIDKPPQTFYEIDSSVHAAKHGSLARNLKHMGYTHYKLPTPMAMP